MSNAAENDARLQELYRMKAALFARLAALAADDAPVPHAELAAAVTELKAADDEINALTEEMFFTLLTDLRH